MRDGIEMGLEWGQIGMGYAWYGMGLEKGMGMGLDRDGDLDEQKIGMKIE